MEKTVIILEVEILTEDIPGVYLMEHQAKTPVSVVRSLKINNNMVFQKQESFESYHSEKSIMKDFISSLTPLGIKELKNGNCPSTIF